MLSCRLPLQLLVVQIYIAGRHNKNYEQVSIQYNETSSANSFFSNCNISYSNRPDDATNQEGT